VGNPVQVRPSTGFHGYNCSFSIGNGRRLKRTAITLFGPALSIEQNVLFMAPNVS
jgi:hypothetical protein